MCGAVDHNSCSNQKPQVFFNSGLSIMLVVLENTSCLLPHCISNRSVRLRFLRLRSVPSGLPLVFAPLEGLRRRVSTCGTPPGSSSPVFSVITSRLFSSQQLQCFFFFLCGYLGLNSIYSITCLSSIWTAKP